MRDDIPEFPEYDAAVTLIEATGLSVSDALRYDDEGRLDRSTYVIAFPAIPSEIAQARSTSPVDFEHGVRTIVLDLQSVSPSATKAARALARALGALVGKTVTVPGRRCDPIRLTLTTSVADDRTTLPPLYYADGSVSITTRPGGTP